MKLSILIIVVIILGGLGYLAFRSFSTKEFKGERKKTIVTIIKVIPYRSGFTNVFRYQCKDNFNEVLLPSRLTQVIGGKYEGYYDSLDNKNVVILYEKPVFVGGEKTKGVLGTIIEIGSAGVLFNYQVKGIEYESMQYMEKGYRSKYSKIKEGVEFSIKYWVKNPQRSIMYFDKE